MKQSIRNKMILFIGIPTVAIYVGVMIWILMYSKHQAHRFHNQEMADRAETAADRFDDYLSKAARIAEVTAGFVSRVPDLSDEQLFGIVSDLVDGNERIYGAALAFEPGSLKSGNELFSPYAYRSNGAIVTKNVDRAVYDWYGDEKWQWWHGPNKSGRGSWTEPYLDEGGGDILMTTYSTPFRKSGEFYGVATIDIDLHTLHAELGKKIVGKRGFYILSADGQFVYSPEDEDVMNTSIFEKLKRSGRDELVDDVRAMLAGDSGVVTLDNLFDNERQMYAFAPITSTGWTFVAYMPESKALAAWRNRTMVVVGAFVAALALILTAIFLVSRRLTKPIEKLRDMVLQVADGDLDARVDGRFSNDEIGDLANSFNRMTTDLKGQIQKLASEEAHREKAEEENRAKSDFLSHMSHELRTPLNGILGYAQILQRDAALASDQRVSVNAIVNCGDHLLSLINDVLDLSKIEAGHLDVDMAPCDLHQLTIGVGDIVGQRARSKGLDFDIDISPDVPQGINSDAAKIRQILVNLLGNAVKFTDEGAVQLKVSESPKGMLSFAVIDSGVGMTAEEIEGIFDPFKQVEAGKAAGGTGLGLAITQRLTDILEGKISVKSEPGKGSNFTVTIPLDEASFDDMSKLDLEHDWNQSAAKLAPGQKASVVIADDRSDQGQSEWSGVPSELLGKLEAALKIRNLTAIKDVAAELSVDEEYASLGAEISKLSMAFDFAGLTNLAERLK